MSSTDLRFRQIHLDFHTSPAIPGIGSDFDPDRFADALARAHVDSVTCFARCHHGHIYYPSKLNPERIHPHLDRPRLLLDQIAACHERGIRVPIYTTVQWDEYTADEHRDWLCIDENGTEFSTKPLDAGFYRFLDVTHPGYRKFLFDHTKEMLETFPVDGLFFDIVQPRFSFARHWLDAMDDAGLDPEDPSARQRFAMEQINAWKLEMTEFIRQINGECTIFYNAGHVGPRHRPTIDAYTHYELESLPSGGWGYLHFPLAVRYARGLGRDYLGMTGKFHTSWGDFQSYKNDAALEFECLHMLAHGAKCSIGDQLHPTGAVDEATYDLIGPVYAKVEAAEPWVRGAKAITEIAVLTPEEFGGIRPGQHIATAERQPAEALGAVRMLQEMQLQFDMVSTDRDLSAYKLLILPDIIPVDEAFAKKVADYLAGGGKLIASFLSGLDYDGKAFQIDQLGVTWKGLAKFSPDFIVPAGDIGRNLRDTAYVMYKQGARIDLNGAETLADCQTPYFNRTWRHFCSHRHTPSSGEVGYPAITRHGDCIYFMHPIFAQYHDNAPQWVRILLGNAIEMLLGDRLVTVDGPSSLLATLNRQDEPNRDVLHLMHYIPERRGSFDIVEDIIPLFDLNVSVKTRSKVAAVQCVPDGKALKFTTDGDRVNFTLPKLRGTQMIEFSY